MRNADIYTEAQWQKRLTFLDRFASDIAFYFDANNVSACTVESGAISQYICPYSGRTFTQATTASRPVVGVGSSGYKRSFVFDGSNDTLFSSTATANAGTIFTVFKINVLKTAGVLWSLNNNGGGFHSANFSSTNQFYTFSIGSRRRFCGNNTSSDGSGTQYFDITTPGISSFAWNIATVQSSSLNLAFNCIGGTDVNGSNSLNGSIQTILCLKSLTPDWLTEVIEGFLMWDAGIATNLVGDHMFINRPPMIGNY